MSDLKPCPFCGGDDLSVHLDDGFSYYVWCGNCGSQTDNDHLTEKEVIEAWNTRPAEDAKNRQIDNLKRALQQIVEIANRRGHLTVATLQKDAWYGLAKIAKEALANAPDNNVGTMEEK